MLAAALTASVVHDRPIKFYTRDAAAATEQHYLLGVVSTAGFVFWSASACVALFTAFITSHRRSFFMFTGLFSLLLLVDDAVMLHEGFFPLHFGLSEKYIFGLYAVLGTILVARHRETLSGPGRGLFIAAILAFMASIAIDLIDDPNSPIDAFEDIPKFLGITLWFSYLFDQSARTLMPLIRN